MRSLKYRYWVVDQMTFSVSIYPASNLDFHTQLHKTTYKLQTKSKSLINSSLRPLYFKAWTSKPQTDFKEKFFRAYSCFSQCRPKFSDTPQRHLQRADPRHSGLVQKQRSQWRGSQRVLQHSLILTASISNFGKSGNKIVAIGD